MIVDLKKRYLYAFAAIFAVVLGVIAVNAFGTNQPQVFGHTPGEIGEGTFFGPAYTFANDLYVIRYLSIGSPGTVPPKLWMAAGAAGLTQNIITSEADGFHFENSTGNNFFTIKNDGDIIIKDGSGITLGGERRVSWPTSGSGGISNVEIRVCTKRSTPTCPSGWTAAGGYSDTNDIDQVGYDSNCEGTIQNRGQGGSDPGQYAMTCYKIIN
jgi:hypothetical protein